MKRFPGLLQQFVKAALVSAVGIGCLCSPAVLSAETDAIPLKKLPPDSRLAIWGDSITEVTLYPRYVEMYLLACAGRKDVKVCTFGHSGETLSGLLSRQSDLEAFKPTIVSFNYGMNDTQYSPYTKEKGAAFDKTMHSVLAMLAEKGITQRIVAGPDAVDDNFNRDKPEAFFRGAPMGGLTAAQAQNVTLRHFRDFGRAAAVETGSAFADVHCRMLASYHLAKKDLGPKFGLDVHPTPGGHFLIAYELLKALACDGDVGAIDIDMKGEARASAGHSVVSFSGGAVVLDSSKYPFCYNHDPFTSKDVNGVASIAPYVPFSKNLNRLMLKVANLGAPSANVAWGSQTRVFTREQLAKGVNLTEHFSQTPFDAAFAHVMAAILDKQEFENYMIKLTSNYNANDNGGNIDDNMIAVHARKDAAVKALLVPVRHTIAIVPIGGPETAPPVITGTMTAYAMAGQAFTYQISALHAPTNFTAVGLPKGLNVNAATGEITGTPREAGVSSISLTATNGHGIGMGTLTLKVAAPLPDRPTLTSPMTAKGTVGAAFTYQITATNAPTHYFATSPGTKGTVAPASSLPAGLTYDMATGLLSGAPKAGGTYPIQIAAMNRRGVVCSLITLTVTEK
jgi:GDSL-like Lipase/Acylhydrolase family/Putative Ig domain